MGTVSEWRQMAEMSITRYFDHFHPYFPVVRLRDPDQVYQDSPLLFWVIILTACRRFAKDAFVFGFLVDAVPPELWAVVGKPPLFVNSINAVLLLCAWPLPNIRFVRDPSFMLANIAMGACYAIGLHTGCGAHREYTYPTYGNTTTTDEAAVYTWAGYNILSQRYATFSPEESYNVGTCS